MLLRMLIRSDLKPSAPIFALGSPPASSPPTQQVPTDCPLKEPWYKTAHSAGPLPAEWLTHWEAAWGGEGAALGDKDGHRFCGMHLPPPNPYIPSRFDLIKVGRGNGGGGFTATV